MSDASAEHQKPKQKGNKHDVLQAAEKVSSVPNGRLRMISIFETIQQQIAADIALAKQQPDVASAVAVFEETAKSYVQNKQAIIDKLDRITKA